MTPQRVLITGGAGMLATDVAAYLQTLEAYEPLPLSRAALDITNLQQIENIFVDYKPNVVINTAALMVEECEISPEKAYSVNAWSVRNLARYCERYDATFVQISTCGLFGDELRPYHEYDTPQLKTVYAKSKKASETYTRQFCQRHFILRIGWLYGGGIEHRRNFIVARYREAQKNSVLRSAYDKHGSPTYTGDVAKTIVSLLESQEYGLYHVANQGKATRAEYVRYILQEFGLKNLVEEVDSSYFPRKANVPDCEWLTSYNLTYAAVPLLSEWQEALSQYIHQLRSQIN